MENNNNKNTPKHKKTNDNNKMRGKDKERGWEMPDNRAGGDRRQSVTVETQGKRQIKETPQLPPPLKVVL